MTTTRNPLTELSASEATRAMREGEFEAEEYAGALLAEAAATSDLNAFIAFDAEAVLAAARDADRRRSAGEPLGMLHGLPVPVKDSIDTTAFPTTNGTAALQEWRPTADAEVVRRMAAAGAQILGKTNMTELSFGWTSNNGTFGAVHNPYDPARVPGGSSGGSAVAVAARVAPLALGADTLGSIRVPASFSGVAGFRPTFGRYPNTGAFSLTHDRLDQVGPLARTVVDISLFDSVVTGEEPMLTRPLAGVRIGIPPFYFGGLEGSVRSVIEAACDRLRHAGVVLVDADVPEVVTTAFDAAAAIMLFEAEDGVERYLRTTGLDLSIEELVEQMAPAKREFFREVALPPGRPPKDARDAMVARSAEVREAIIRFLGEYELAAIAYPAVAAPPPQIGEEHSVDIDGEHVSFFAAFGRNTALAPVAGIPALTLPAGFDRLGLPVGLALDGAPGDDRALLAIGAALEQVLAFDGDGRPRPMR